MSNSSKTSADETIAAFLSAYSAPIEDGGFTDRTLAAAAAQADMDSARMHIETKIRRWSVYAACFVGGLIAAAQLPKLLSILADSSRAAADFAVPFSQGNDARLSSVTDMLATGLSGSTVVIGAAVAALIIWVIVDAQGGLYN